MSVAILVVFFFRPDVFFRFFFVFLDIYNLLYKNVINSLKRKEIYPLVIIRHAFESGDPTSGPFYIIYRPDTGYIWPDIRLSKWPDIWSL